MCLLCCRIFGPKHPASFPIRVPLLGVPRRRSTPMAAHAILLRANGEHQLERCPLYPRKRKSVYATYVPGFVRTGYVSCVALEVSVATSWSAKIPERSIHGADQETPT